MGSLKGVGWRRGIPALTPGSLGNIYIYSQPKLRIEDFVVHATLDSARVNGVVWVTVVMANSYRSSEKISLGYDIYSPVGKLITYNLYETEVEPESFDTLRFKEYIYPSMKKDVVSSCAQSLQYDVLCASGWPYYGIYSVPFRI